MVVEPAVRVEQKQAADSVLVGSLDLLVFPMLTLLFLHCNNKPFLQESCAQAISHHWYQSLEDLYFAAAAAVVASAAASAVGLAS